MIETTMQPPVGRFFKGAIKDPVGHKVSGAHLVVGAAAPEVTIREYSLRTFSPPPADQRQTSRCTGFGYARMQQACRFKHETERLVLSPGGIYTLGRMIDRDDPHIALEDGGAQPNQVERAQLEWGTPREADWPTLDNNVNTEASGPQFQHADTLRLGTYYHINEDATYDFDAFRRRVCQVLLSGSALAGYCEVDAKHENWDGRGVLTTPGISLGGHEICFLGFRDYGHEIEWCGSWGEEWGSAGYGFGDEGFIRAAGGWSFIRPQ